MPFKPVFSETVLGHSKRLDYLRQRLERDPAMKYLYTDFLNEYELLNHMEAKKETNDFYEEFTFSII